MKHLTIALVALLLVSGVWAQNVTTARDLGMGTASIAVAEDGAAWYQNPAGIPNLKGGPEILGWSHDIIGTYGNLDDGLTSLDGWALSWTGKNTNGNWGVGAGVADLEDWGSGFGAGFGMMLKDTGFSWGANVVFDDPEMDESNTLVNLGAMYRMPLTGIRLGLTIEDILDDTDHGPFFNVGAYWPIMNTLALAVDILDITDETDDGPYLNAGAEFSFGTLLRWSVRAGMRDNGDDTDLTAGLGFKLVRGRIDVGYADTADGEWAVSAGIDF